MSDQLREARERVAIQSKEHMKLWMQESKRRYIVLDGFDLVDAVWPGNQAVGVQELQDLLSLYRNHRRGIPNGKYEEMDEPLTGQKIQIALHKDEILEPEEMDRAIRYFVSLIREAIPTWSLDDPQL